MLLEPGFRAEDFTRLREDAINFLKVSLRESNDEELGKEHLYNVIYAGHPYGHHNAGKDQLARKAHDRRRARLLSHPLHAGESGDRTGRRLSAKASTKKSKQISRSCRTARPTKNASTVRNCRRNADRNHHARYSFDSDLARLSDRSESVAKDWPALALVASYFGQHRSSNSYLYQRLREARGLNYGDYAYIEYFPRGMFLMTPDPNLARQQQIFQIWIRPVEAENGMFALRAALYEYDKLVRDGISQEAFETTREFLDEICQCPDSDPKRALGYALDSRYYGIPEYNTYMKTQLPKLTFADVNAAIRRHLKSDRMRIVLVTKNGGAHP